LPTYEYACKACGHRLEAVQKFTDDALTVCPDCGGALRKVFGAVGISFKGSGFYKTDSRASSGGGGKGGEAKESPSKDKESSNGATPDSGTKTESTKSEGTKSESAPKESSPKESKTAKPAATTAS
jgi:putative FmdB family regulatory protein